MKTSSLVLSAAVLAGAGFYWLKASPNNTATPPEPASHPNQPPSYALHEWGTFTSVAGSDGELLPGLEREEEPLPPFVYAHEGMENRGNIMAMKGWKRPLAGVTIKMETPVIYFYADQSFPASVEVGFRGGSISQWYPSRAGGETPPPLRRGIGLDILDTENTLDFTGGKYQGSIRWDLEVAPEEEASASAVFKGSELPNWLYPRQTDSALVRVKRASGELKGNALISPPILPPPMGQGSHEYEKYLFYRGVGNFSLPLRIRSLSDGELLLTNTGNRPLGPILLFESEASQARFRMISSIPAGGESKVSLSMTTFPFQASWQREVYESMAGALVAEGLFRKEADAMLQTWWSSYFSRPGLRAFWVVPRAFTDEILPLKVSPAPKETVRVLVGRSEILTPGFERQLVGAFAKAESNPFEGDRYGLAYAERVKRLAARP